MKTTISTIIGLLVVGYGLTAYGAKGRTFTVAGHSKYHVFEEYNWHFDAVVLRDHQRRHTLVPYRWLSRSDQDYVDFQPGVVTKEEVRRGREKRPFYRPTPGPAFASKYNWKYPGEWKYRFR